MAESRDRLVRTVDIAELFSRRRSGIQRIYLDRPDLETALFGSPVTRLSNSVTRSTTSVTRVNHRGSPRNQSLRGRNLYRYSGRENNNGNGNRNRNRGRGGRRVNNSVLPSWFPRTPLRDISAIVRAIERRRERLGEGRVQEIESPVPQDHEVPDSSEPSPTSPLQHSTSLTSPIPGLRAKRCPPTVGKVPKILLDITNKASNDDSEFLTPQKKLLNSIDTVEKQVKEELQKLQRTATAKKAEREKKVRTLMSMR